MVCRTTDGQPGHGLALPAPKLSEAGRQDGDLLEIGYVQQRDPIAGYANQTTREQPRERAVQVNRCHAEQISELVLTELELKPVFRSKPASGEAVVKVE